jgi:uncharacterized protein YjlB
MAHMNQLDLEGDLYMYLREGLKSRLERMTGLGRPTLRQINRRIRGTNPKALYFEDNNCIPNNPKLPFLHYRKVISLKKAADAAALFEILFDANGWRDSWRNGIYDYAHYHPRTHEVLGISRGKARVQFGGDKGKRINLTAGDVVVLPAGTGHQALKASPDLVVVGAYPGSGHYDEYEPRASHHTRALSMIPKVRLPAKDPIFGTRGPLKRLWRKRKKSK